MTQKIAYKRNDSCEVIIDVANLPKFTYEIIAEGNVMLEFLNSNRYLLQVINNDINKVHNKFDGCISAHVSDGFDLKFRYTKLDPLNGDTLVQLRKVTDLLSEYCFYLPKE